MSDADRMSVRLRCPNERQEGHPGITGYDLFVKRGADYVRFTCTDCLTVFLMSHAQVRRLMVRWTPA